MDVPLPRWEDDCREKSGDGMPRKSLEAIGSAVLLATVCGVNGMTRLSLGSMRPSSPYIGESGVLGRAAGICGIRKDDGAAEFV